MSLWPISRYRLPATTHNQLEMTGVFHTAANNSLGLRYWCLSFIGDSWLAVGVGLCFSVLALQQVGNLSSMYHTFYSMTARIGLSPHNELDKWKMDGYIYLCAV